MALLSCRIWTSASNFVPRVLPPPPLKKDPGFGLSRGTQNLCAWQNLLFRGGGVGGIVKCAIIATQKGLWSRPSSLWQQVGLQPNISTSQTHFRSEIDSRFFYSGRMLIVHKNYVENTCFGTPAETFLTDDGKQSSQNANVYNWRISWFPVVQ